jgi:2-keto-4-pentenoate hydratase/2-oxohepta-3-ene-1,7-dioic acid hydratase in catechol pathway
VPESRAADVIFGYTVATTSPRVTCKKSDGQWARAKGYDTFCPSGPWITTHQTLDEVADPRHPHHPRRGGEAERPHPRMVHAIPALLAYIPPSPPCCRATSS